MKDKKNIILLIFAIVFFIIAIMFFIWSFFGEHKTKINIDDIDNNQINTLNNITQNKVEQENITKNQEINNSETSNTEDVYNISYTDMTIYDKNNNKIYLSEYENNSIMILFWNPENEDSITVLKKVNNLYEKYKEKIKFLMISTSNNIPENIKNEFSIDIYYDLDNQYQEKYNVQTIPTMIYIYKDNTILNAKSGVPSSDAIEANLDILSDNF